MNLPSTAITWSEPLPPPPAAKHVLGVHLLEDGCTLYRRWATEADLAAAGFVRKSDVPEPAPLKLRELAAWAKIDKWLRTAPKDRTVCITPDVDGEWYAMPSDHGNPFDGVVHLPTSRWDSGPTKLEALEALAKWCEANP